MLNLLDLGIGFDAEGDPYSIIVNQEKLIPEDYKYLFRFLYGAPELLTSIDQDVVMYINGTLPNAETILTKIESIHPYFSYPGFAVWLLNRSVADKLWKQGNITKNFSLFSKLVVKELPTQSDDLNDYIVADEGHETTETLLDLKKDLQARVTLLFNDANHALASLKPEQRASLYSFTRHESGDSVNLFHVPVSMSIPTSRGMRSFGAAMDFDDDLAERFEKAVRSLESSGSALPHVIQSAVAYSDGNRVDSTVTYEIHTLKDLFDLESFQMISKGIRVKRCINCGKLFPVTHEGQKCCTFTRINGLTCYDLERNRISRMETKKKLSDLRQRAYKKHYARVKAGTETEADLEAWKKRASDLYSKVNNGIINLAEYEKQIQ